MASTHSNPSPGRGRGGRGRGRGRGRGGSNKMRHASPKPPHGNKEPSSTDPIAPPSSNVHNTSSNTPSAEMTDQQVLIAFGPHVRDGNADAMQIHQLYLSTHDQLVFLTNARAFLERQRVVPQQSVHTNAVERIAAQVDEAVKAAAQMSVSDATSRAAGAPPGMLPPPGLAQHTLTSSIHTNGDSPSKKNVPTNILPTPVKETARDIQPPVSTTSTPAKLKVRRTQTRPTTQPGRLHTNGISTTSSTANNALTVPLRSELSAKWILPLKHLRERVLRRSSSSDSTQHATVRDALHHLTVGLFRYGAADNGSSIVSKEILNENEKDHPFDVDTKLDLIYGTVPFYSPRTPGNVVFRLYFDDEPHVTLATGPMVTVVPQSAEYSSVLRFLLSNFKSKKPNLLSSIHSFGAVLELFTADGMGDEAGRACYGCICETRKVVENAASSYVKKKVELDELERELDEAEKVKKDLLEMASSDVIVRETKKEEEEEDNSKEGVSDERSKLMKDRFTNERNWKDMQLAYAMLLEAIVKNDATRFLFKENLLHKMRLEYDLWCPLCESFAPNPVAVDDNSSTSFLVQTVSKSWQTKMFEDSRRNMQKEVLGFVPVKDPLPSIVASNVKSRDIFTDFSNAMTALYMDEYRVSDDVHSRREAVRSGIEQVVTASGAFPEGTRVAVFGSSANGFGSPSSDLDLCLQIPQSAEDFTKENGVAAMTQLAQKFTEDGMLDVDTVRLTARIPIVKFNFPYKQNGDITLVECDLSLQNPLACLNTALLNTYSKISPDTCILASIIKRWAKMRDINNPAMHTLSSYGYVLMLLYYLTSSEPRGDGFVSDPGIAKGTNPPILANLQRVDPTWAQNPVGPYREILAKPHNQYFTHQHPTEPDYMVNSYFYRSGLDKLQQYHVNKSKNGPCLGILLASFFRFFAYEFDYKKFVVSLDTKRGECKQKEVKAEEDGWYLYKPGLAIEDPFEHFYDVAHVVKTSNFHHIQHEFALAFSKIASVVYGDRGFVSGRDLIDLICEPVPKRDA